MKRGASMKINGLTHQRARNLEAGKYNDGQGLWLHKRNKHGGKWIIRLFIEGKRREMGLGGWPDVSIAEARTKAASAREQVRNGENPIVLRQAVRRHAKRMTLNEAVQSCFEARKAELKNDGQAGRWMSPLSVHVLPKIGKTALEDINQHILKDLLEPIWHTKPEASKKAINRINLVLQHGAALGLDVDIQAVQKARALLGKQRRTVTHIPSLSYQKSPAFYQHIASKDLMSCYALRFLMLTVARTSEVRLATHQEIKGEIWTIPAERNKTNAEHRIPLTDEALRVIEQAKNKTEYLFISPQGKPLSDASMSSFMKREGHEARPHGFRATFRTWVEEQTETPFEVKETALGHKVDTGVVGAYQRSDRLEKRAVLMREWEQYLLT